MIEKEFQLELWHNQLKRDKELIKQTKYAGTHIGVLFMDENDTSTTYIVLCPTFEMLCFQPSYYNEDITVGGRTLSFRDIRLSLEYEKHPEFKILLYTEARLFNPRYEVLYEKTIDRFKEHLTERQIKKGIKTFMRAVLIDNSNPMKFVKRLTDIEKLAIESIIQYVGTEGYFSQQKLCEETRIPRATFTNVVQKLEDAGMADITRCGQKGTHIVVTDSTIMDIMGKNYGQMPDDGYH